MKQILFSGWLPEWQDREQGKPSCTPWITLFVQQKRILFWPYNQSFTDQARLVEMSEYYPCIFIDLGFISVHKNAKGTWPTTSYLDLLLGQWRINNIQFCQQTQFKLHYTSLWLTPGVKESMGSLIIRYPRILNRVSLYYLHV